MPLYAITFLNRDGSVSHTEEVEAADDDAVLDRIRDSPHPHAIDVHQGGRHVGRFAPVDAP